MRTYLDNGGYRRPAGRGRAERGRRRAGRQGLGPARPRRCRLPGGHEWGFLPAPDGGPRYLVVNADESEPGTCKDIPLMLAQPQALIEGVAITAYAIGCHHAFIYVRGEVLHVYRRLLRAVEEAYAEGFLGTAARLRLRPRGHGARRRRRVHLRRA